MFNKTKDCFTVSGRLDFTNTPDLWKKSRDLIASSIAPIYIDLSAVTYSDSSGLALLLSWLSVARKYNKRLYFRQVPQQMLAMIRVVELEKILPIET